MPSRSLLTSLAVCGLIAATLTATPVAHSAEPVCNGVPADIVGTNKPDTLVGTEGDDVIVGFAGRDIIDGRGGNDLICGGWGDDVIDGGTGGDTIFASDGDDTINGGGGNDRIYGAKGSDAIKAAGGADQIWLGNGKDRVDAGWGDDIVKGGRGNDTILGNAGDDIVYGGDDSDECDGEDETDCEFDPNDFGVERFLVNQGAPLADSSQPAANRISPVAARSGLARAFVTADRSATGTSPTVVLHWRKNGNEGHMVLDGPGTVPVNPSAANLSDTYNWAFAESFLRLGAEVFLKVDPANEYFEANEGNNRWPASGYYDLDVAKVPPFGVTLVPIKLNGVTAAVAPQSGADLLAKTEKVFPIAGSNVTVRAAYTFNGSTQNDWQTLLYEIAQLRVSDGSSDLYVAILPGPISGGIGGIGFIGAPAAVSIQSPGIVAHEIGHTLNLPHAPCGGPAGPDPNYPYATGSIGTWGYDIVTGAVFDPSSYKDLMSYCNPTWVSDYNFGKVLDFRTSSWGYGAPEPLAAGQTALTVFGEIEEPALETWALEGAGEMASVLSVVDTPFRERGPVGDYTLIGLDADGRVLASTSFEPLEYHLYGTHAHEDRTMFWTQLVVSEADVDRMVEYQVIRRESVIGTGRMPARTE
jgi:hypothetical protein